MPKMLACMTTPKYTDANLRFDHLKDKDRATPQCLQYACEKIGFRFFLASLEHTVNGGCEDEGWGGGYGYGYGNEDDDDDEGDPHSNSEGIRNYSEIFDALNTTFKLRTVFTATGSKIAEDISISQMDVVDDDPFPRNPDREDYEGYGGNVGVPAIHYYRNSCSVPLETTERRALDVERVPGKKEEEWKANRKDPVENYHDAQVSISTASEGSFSLAKEWLSQCFAEHKLRREAQLSSLVLPTRLLDVGHPGSTISLQLRVARHIRPYPVYLTLSHC